MYIVMLPTIFYHAYPHSIINFSIVMNNPLRFVSASRMIILFDGQATGILSIHSFLYGWHLKFVGSLG